MGTSRYHFRDLRHWRDDVTRADMESIAAYRRGVQHENEIKNRMQARSREKFLFVQTQMRPFVRAAVARAGEAFRRDGFVQVGVNM